jgi:hypothetical protein
MAIGKNKIIVYADWISLFDKLTNEEAGKLIKHFFNYVNDLNPVCDDRLTELLFEPIKATLKRDLQKWEEKTDVNRENGKKGGRPKKTEENPNKPNAFFETHNNPKKGVSDSVSDSVSVNESISFKNELLNLNFNEQLVDEWLSIRKAKKAKNTETALKAFIREVKKANIPANDILQICVERSWSGFDATWLNNLNTNKNGNTQQPTNNEERRRSYLERVLYGSNEPIDSERSQFGKDDSAFDAVEIVES